MKRSPLIVPSVWALGIAFLAISAARSETTPGSGLRPWKPPFELKAPAPRPRAAAPAPDYVPDTTVILRVNDRAITAYDFRERYFSADYAFRPRPDSAGRAEFLQSLINKEVLGQ